VYELAVAISGCKLNRNCTSVSKVNDSFSGEDNIWMSYQLKLLNILEAENFMERHAFNGLQKISVP